MSTPSTPPGWYPDPGQGPPPKTPAPTDSRDARAGLILRYGIGNAIGAALLLGTVLWAVLGDDNTDAISISSPSTSTSATTPTAESTETATESPATDARPGEAVNVNLAFTVTSLNSAPEVTSPTNELLTKAATGEFVIVALRVKNIGEVTSYYLSNQQRLKSGTDSYQADAEASYYLGNLYEEISPGDQVETVLVFDVPPGTVPDAIEVHGDAVAEGTDIPLQ